MTQSRHVLAAVSSHGLGQVASVINALWRQWPELAVTLRSGYSRELLAQWLAGPFVHQPVSDALVMHDAVSVDVAASLARYRELHAQWDERVEAVAAELEAAAPDLVLADIAYLTPAAVQQLGIAHVAMVFAEIARHRRLICWVLWTRLLPELATPPSLSWPLSDAGGTLDPAGWAKTPVLRGSRSSKPISGALRRR